MPAWVEAGFDEYARRMPREAPLSLLEVKPEPRTEKSRSERAVDKAMQAEGARVAAVVPKDAYTVALDERGTLFTTRELAERYARWQMQSSALAFIIGGADGLAPSVKQGAGLLWSLSPLTLPHGLVRVVVAEQLYRVVSLQRNHPYHRE